ncbi:MAG: hypothetical protein HYU99_04820 [Deltaproteobacteria bacterium]|nr:hypothetical protein [Deltaproteobacteria bacterium]
MKKIISFIAVVLMLGVIGAVWAIEAKDVVGEWSMDAEKSAGAPDGNVAGLMSKVTIKSDGTFEAMYGTKGKWKSEGGKVLVTYDNSARSGEEASMDGTFLKFPSPAMAGQFCYLKKGGEKAASAPAATSPAPSDAAKSGY